MLRLKATRRKGICELRLHCECSLSAFHLSPFAPDHLAERAGLNLGIAWSLRIELLLLIALTRIHKTTRQKTIQAVSKGDVSFCASVSSDSIDLVFTQLDEAQLPVRRVGHTPYFLPVGTENAIRQELGQVVAVPGPALSPFGSDK